jgi:hypothetical protein
MHSLIVNVCDCEYIHMNKRKHSLTQKTTLDLAIGYTAHNSGTTSMSLR